jgi:hypothetical protein
MRKRYTLLQVAKTISVSLPASLFAWILMVLMNPIFEHVYVLLLLQPLVYLVVELVLYLHRLWSQSVERRKKEAPLPAPAPNKTKKKDIDCNPPLGVQRERELLTPEEEWAYLALMYY